MTIFRTMSLAAAAMTLAACGEDGPVANDLNESASASAMINSAGEATPASTVDGSAPADATATGTARPGQAAAAIPAALHGRWGLTPGDCTSTRGDAKGLLTIGPADLRFYESRAVPAAKVETSADAISGDFAFTGEGQSWTRYQSLELQKDRLARTERDPNGSFSYVRCD